MRAHATTDPPAGSGADTVAVGVFEDFDPGRPVAHDRPGGELAALVDSGEARGSFKHLALTHEGGMRWLVVGLGARPDFSPERARVAAAVVLRRAAEIGARCLCWELPHHVPDDVAGALVEGTMLAAYRFDRFRSAPPESPRAVEELIVSAHHDVGEAVARAVVLGEAVNAARDLQNAPANVMTPGALAARARELDGVTVEVLGRAEIEARGMGAFAAVARGSQEEPALITISWAPEDARGPHLALVGKAVTFDSGGISLKPGKGMEEMKFDMSGGAAVLEAIGAIARLRLPLRVSAVVGATENMPSGNAVRPGDVLTAMTGTTIEVANTDCEGRLVLADCLAHAVALGAERIVDLATLTGAVITTFGHTHAGLFADDDAWAEEVAVAAERTGELAWRLPLHEEYAELITSATADLRNQSKGGASSVTAAAFLQRFTGDVPWAHLDIAGTAWSLGRAYAPKQGSGWGVRLLVDLAESLTTGL